MSQHVDRWDSAGTGACVDVGVAAGAVPPVGSSSLAPSSRQWPPCPLRLGGFVPAWLGARSSAAPDGVARGRGDKTTNRGIAGNKKTRTNGRDATLTVSPLCPSP